MTDSLQYRGLSGTQKHFNRKGLSGKNVKYTFCDNCCTLMTVEAEAFEGMIIVKPGTLDDKDAINSSKPTQKLFTKDRPTWCAELAGTKQVEVH